MNTLLLKPLIAALFFASCQAQAQVPITVPTTSFHDPDYPLTQTAPGYGFQPAMAADILFEEPSAYIPSIANRYFMSSFGPRYKTNSHSTPDNFDFHQGMDITSTVTINGVAHNPTTPPDISSRCDGLIDQIENGPLELVEQTGQGRYVTVKCDETFSNGGDWGHIYMSYRHLQDVEPSLVVGASISAGDLLGTMGQTGHTTTTHLHFSLSRHDGTGYHNVHPMWASSRTSFPHLLAPFSDAEITQLSAGVDQALFRIAIPHAQANVRAITVSLADGTYERTYDYEHVSAVAGNDRDNNDFVDGIELFAYPYNQGDSAYFRYLGAKENMPIAYPASPLRGAGNYFPILNEGIYTTPAYVLDVLAKDLPPGYNINELKISVIDIYGYGVEAHGAVQAADSTDKYTVSIINSSDDDAEEHDNGTVNLSDADLELVNDGSRGNQTVGLRFTGLGIPQGAFVTKAYIQFMADETHSGETTVRIEAENVASAAPFTLADFDISSRQRTIASVSWQAQEWVAIGDTSASQRTDDLSLVLQEVVNKTGWSEDSALAIILTGAGKRVAESYDAYYKKSAYIYVEYSTVAPVENIQPSVVLSAPSDNTSYDSLAIIQLEANAADSDGSVSSVDFYANDQWVGSSSSSPFVVDWAIPQFGSHTLRAVAIDDDNAEAHSNTITIHAYQNKVDVRITDGKDDAEERESGSVARNGTDLELGYDSYVSQKYGLTGFQHVGMRFQGIAVPAGSTVTRAYIEFTTDEKDSDDSHLVIEGELAGDATPFTYSSHGISGRYTTNTVDWQPEAWTVVGEVHNTPDLSALVQEIIDQSDWAGGNAMVLVVSGSAGTRTAESYNGSAGDAPLLHIEFTAP